jgi:DnaJ-class molecular chaperone
MYTKSMDYYKILGVAKTANEQELKKAYRKLAMENHPDRTGGDDSKFKQINEAYDTLKDPQKRQAYDNPQQQQYPQGFGPGGFQGVNPGGFEDMFASMFGGGPFRNQQPRNKDVTIAYTMQLEDVYNGAETVARYRKSNGSIAEVRIRIPPGIGHGQTVRFQGMGDDAIQQFQPGDLNVVIKYASHKKWQVDGVHLKQQIRVSLLEALKGTKVDINTLDGNTIRLTIPKGTNSNTTFSIHGHGLPVQNGRGNAYIQVKVKMPTLTDEQLMQIEQIFGT